MYLSTLPVAFAGLLSQTLAAPNAAEIGERALLNNCNRDNLFRSFIDPRYSSSASAFCSTYIRQTVQATATATTTVTPAGKARRANTFAVATYPATRLSSACSCILTATPAPTTVVTTVVATVTATATPGTCSVSTPIVKNGGFDGGKLSPWTVTTIPDEGYEQYFDIGVKSPGFGGTPYAFYARQSLASSYVQIGLSQTLTVCPGKKYNLAAQYILPEKTFGPPPRQAYVQAFVDENQVFLTNVPTGDGNFKPLTGSFTAGASGSAVLRFQFTSTEFTDIEYALDSVTVTPA